MFIIKVSLQCKARKGTWCSDGYPWHPFHFVTEEEVYGMNLNMCTVVMIKNDVRNLNHVGWVKFHHPPLWKRREWPHRNIINIPWHKLYRQSLWKGINSTELIFIFSWFHGNNDGFTIDMHHPRERWHSIISRGSESGAEERFRPLSCIQAWISEHEFRDFFLWCMTYQPATYKMKYGSTQK